MIFEKIHENPGVKVLSPLYRFKESGILVVRNGDSQTGAHGAPRRLRHAEEGFIHAEWHWGTSDVLEGKRLTEHRMVAGMMACDLLHQALILSVWQRTERKGPPNVLWQLWRKCDTRAQELVHPFKREQRLLQGMSGVLPSETRMPLGVWKTHVQPQSARMWIPEPPRAEGRW